MAIELSKGRKILLYISVFLTAIAVMGEMGISPIIYNLYGAFENQMAVNYIVSGAALFVVFGSLAATFVMNRISKKTLLLIATVIFCGSSIFCVSVDHVYYICVMRSLMGFGEGAVNAVVMAYVAQLFLDEGKRASFMGYYNASMTLFAIAMSYASGMLGSVDWRNAFTLYWPSALMIIGVLLFVPNLQELDDVSQKSAEAAGKKEALGKLYWMFIIAYIVFTWMYAMVNYFISAYVVENKLGGTSFAGILVSCTQVGGVICSLLFGVLYTRLKKNLTSLCILMLMLALAMYYFIPGGAVAVIASALIGGGYGMYFSYSYTYVAEVVPPSRIDDAIGYTTAFYGVAFFVFPYLVSFMQSVVSPKGLYTPLFPVWALIGLIPLAIELATNSAYKKMMVSRS